jgi:putative hydrolase of the HAD superfamily
MLPPLVCFDAGFTLIQPRQTMAGHLADALVAHGHHADDDEVRRAWEAADAWFWTTYQRPGNTAWTNDHEIEATWRAYHRIMLAEVGFRDEEHRVVEAILAAQLATSAWELYPDTVAALELTRNHPSRAGLPAPRIAVISDWGSNLGEVIDVVGLRGFVDVLAVSAVEALAKPDPAFFRRASERAGIDPGQGVMIGDSYHADVLGARAAGLDAILLDRHGTATIPDDPGVAIARTLPEAVEMAAARGVARTA